MMKDLGAGAVEWCHTHLSANTTRLQQRQAFGERLKSECELSVTRFRFLSSPYAHIAQVSVSGLVLALKSAKVCKIKNDLHFIAPVFLLPANAFLLPAKTVTAISTTNTWCYMVYNI